jgi:hypothetical protein
MESEQMTDLVAELQLRVSRLEELVKARIRPPREGKPHLARVLDVMRARGGDYMTANEIATAAEIDPGAARLVLYEHKNELFISVRISTGRVKWQLSPRARFECPTRIRPAEEHQMA